MQKWSTEYSSLGHAAKKDKADAKPNLRGKTELAANADSNGSDEWHF